MPVLTLTDTRSWLPDAGTYRQPRVRWAAVEPWYEDPFWTLYLLPMPEVTAAASVAHDRPPFVESAGRSWPPGAGVAPAAGAEAVWLPQPPSRRITTIDAAAGCQ